MSLNCDKCKILKVYRSRNLISHQYTMNGTPLDSVSHHPYLGVVLSSNLNWSFHVENIIGKANRFLGFIRRNLYSCPENGQGQTYLTLVRPCLEYACSTLKSIATILKEYSGSRQISKKLLRERTRYSHQFPEGFELGFTRTETQNCTTYNQIQNGEQ